ncbi:formimidoylglutamase [Biformimicrobium ophioploci]|uniref:Formimidoylglutamase n=1 Tax=Biformimicrobium ophioploci TaxID=3036711 RepID=A0ABQ6LUR8_9GAMM|nr:formimidoylglutamase [Microbulbifer sp. NKW57]GMG85828.1 formimidoylglutamase [Microbulbifer sp. NKW57]
MLSLADMRLWKGRTDPEDGELGKRWHERVQPLGIDSPPGVAVLGFSSDEGVRRNKGRVGAADGPRILRLAMAPLPKVFEMPVYDAGNVRVLDRDLESAQSQLGVSVADLLSNGHFPLVLGGGHEIAFGTYQGIARWMRENHREKSLGIVNFDAHLDIRVPAPDGSSGTPFYQIAEHAELGGRAFNYLCIGAAATANTPALMQRAAEMKVEVIEDREITPWALEAAKARVQAFIDRVDMVYLTIDLDVFPASVMPAVSAPAGRGLPFELFEVLLGIVMESGKVCAADMAEFNPYFDIEDHSARTVARIAYEITKQF